LPRRLARCKVSRPEGSDIRGYFAIGVEGISKPMHLGTLLRSAHAFGASFFFTIAPAFDAREVKVSDTSDAARHLPLYNYDTLDEFMLPRGCSLVGVELDEDAVDLPSFRHPQAAAYVLGPERGALSPELTARCQHLVRIPAKFCVNVGTAGAIVMYDRIMSLGRFPGRPVVSGGPVEPLPPHVRGAPVRRKQPAKRT
jgi:tRNA G18 (ribose-2'-O)-methylase SpoU